MARHIEIKYLMVKDMINEEQTVIDHMGTDLC